VFKQASVAQLLTGHTLGKSVPSNYRPISNLNLIWKILERLFLSRFQSRILNSRNFNRHQCAYYLAVPSRPLYNFSFIAFTAWLMETGQLHL